MTTTRLHYTTGKSKGGDDNSFDPKNRRLPSKFVPDPKWVFLFLKLVLKAARQAAMGQKDSKEKARSAAVPEKGNRSFVLLLF
jgi:hypothetical protein